MHPTGNIPPAAPVSTQDAPTSYEGDSGRAARASATSATSASVGADERAIVSRRDLLPLWPVVPKGGGVHGYVSGYRLKGRWTGCPHWHAGSCQRDNLADGPHERPACAVGGWGLGGKAAGAEAGCGTRGMRTVNGARGG